MYRPPSIHNSQNSHFAYNLLIYNKKSYANCPILAEVLN